MLQTQAKLNYLRISPRKVRPVADLVRGTSAQEALIQLSFSNHRAAEPLHTLIASAVANAENNHNLDPETLSVSSITVNDGPTYKRYRPKGMGRAGLIERKTSHVAVVLEGERGEGGAPQRKKPKVVEEPEEATPSEIAESTNEEQAGKSLRKAEKKMGKQKEDSFVRRIFRRKSI